MFQILFRPMARSIAREALPFWSSREACPIFLGPKILSRLIFVDLVFCLFKFIFLGFHLVENLYFWINRAYNKDEFNKKFKMDSFQRPCRPPYRNVEHWKMFNLYFGYLLLTTFAKDYIFGSNCQKLGHASLPNLVSTDPLGSIVLITIKPIV